NRRVFRVAGQHVPAGAVLAVEAERDRQVVDSCFLLVGTVAVLALPEEALGGDELRERGAIFLFCGLAKLAAERRERRVGDRDRQDERDRLVGFWGGPGPRRGRGARSAAVL